VIGCLDGQASLERNRFVVHAAPWPADSELTLMLREWTSAGYVTRDYRLLEQPALTTAAAEPVAAVPAAEPAQASVPVATAAPAQAVTAATAVDSEPAQTRQLPSTKAQASAQRVSINRASAASISSLKGISDKVAASIVAHRPYSSLDDLLRAKGIGIKRLEQLRAQLEL
jgi:DNA uptake protein ComE-like DNA-binding protein